MRTTGLNVIIPIVAMSKLYKPTCYRLCVTVLDGYTETVGRCSPNPMPCLLHAPPIPIVI